MKDRQSGVSLGFGFVEFESHDVAQTVYLLFTQFNYCFKIIIMCDKICTSVSSFRVW